MNLERIYHELRDMIGKLDLESVWPGFRPLKFALYDDRRCFFDGRYVEKTDVFLANTSIVYKGEQIAIWMITEEPDIPVLASKIVHEMFHGFQTLRSWDSWADEREALCRYGYHPENLCLRLRENELLLSLLDRDDGEVLGELLAHRKRRSEAFPYEFSYESRIEEIEGTANYVEWQILRQLDEDRAEELTGRMRRDIRKASYLFPIRISAYDTGALMIHALRRADLYSFEPETRPAVFGILRDIVPSDGGFPGKDLRLREVTEAKDAWHSETAGIIRAALGKNEVVQEGPCTLLGLNVYNARFYRGYVTTTHFLMLRDGEGDRLLRGDFVIRMRDEKTIDRVWRQA